MITSKKQKFGRVKVKNMRPKRGHMPLEEIPDSCGYEKKFKFDIDNFQNLILLHFKILKYFHRNVFEKKLV